MAIFGHRRHASGPAERAAAAPLQNDPVPEDTSEQSSLDTDGVPRGQAVVDALVELLNLERLEDNLYRGVSPTLSPVGLVIGVEQSNSAASSASRRAVVVVK